MRLFSIDGRMLMMPLPGACCAFESEVAGVEGPAARPSGDAVAFDGLSAWNGVAPAHALPAHQPQSPLMSKMAYAFWMHSPQIERHSSDANSSLSDAASGETLEIRD